MVIIFKTALSVPAQCKHRPRSVQVHAPCLNLLVIPEIYEVILLTQVNFILYITELRGTTLDKVKDCISKPSITFILCYIGIILFYCITLS